MNNDFPARRIRELPASLANQIAAGEVVERPASVVKELLENSLDAAARWTDVDIEQGGVRLIRVSDDGSGIHKHDLASALRRHATSKITSLSDLEQLTSLGFRGEALPSIASVSRLTISSRCRGDDHGWRISADGRAESLVAVPVAHPFGTIVEVRDLFCSTPARRKFLHSERTEQRHLQQIVKRMALSRFDVGFRLQCDGLSLLRLPPANTERLRSQRLAKVCGSAFLQHALQLEFEVTGLRLVGWVAASGFSRAGADLQHVFVNGRWVRDSLITHALRQAYQDRVVPDRFPAYVLYVEIDPRAVDVNVHPTKHEIRFRDKRFVHDFLARSVSRALAQTSAGTSSLPLGQTSGERSIADGGVSRAYALAALELEEDSAGRPGTSGVHDADRSAVRDPVGSLGDDASRHGVQPIPPLGYALGQLKGGSYLLAENAQGLVVVDVREALRNVLHRRLVQAHQRGPLPPRPLLIPLSLPVGPREIRAADSCEALLKRLGFDLRWAGPETLLVCQIPNLLQEADVSRLIRDVLSSLIGSDEGGVDAARAAALLRVMATRGAAGVASPCTLPQMDALLRSMEAADIVSPRNSFGPCWVELSAGEIRRLFRQERPVGA